MSRSPDRELFRQAMSRFPTGVTVVSTTVGGIDHVMTASSFTSVSLDPLLVLVCVSHTTRFHPAVVESGVWAVSFLAAHQVALSRRFAVHGRDLDSTLDDVAVHPGEHTGAPLLDGALATLECRTTQSFEAGDHTVVIGEVLAVVLGADATPALVFHRGEYTELAVDLFED